MTHAQTIKDESLLRRPSFDWDKAKYFYYVAKLGNFTEAAKFLHLSQPSISRKIRILEDRLKRKLFIRLPQGVKMTQDGEELYDIIEQAYLSLKEFTYHKATRTQNSQPRKIRILTTHAMAAYILNEALLSYYEAHPHIIFEVLTDEYAVDIIMDEIDIAIKPYAVANKGLRQEPLFSLKKRLYASEAYLAKHGEPTSIKDLHTHRVLATAQAENHSLSDKDLFLSLSMPPHHLKKPAFLSTALECLVEAAERGIGIIEAYDKLSLIKKSKLKNILPDMTTRTIDWYFICPNAFEEDKHIEDIKLFLGEKLSED